MKNYRRIISFLLTISMLLGAVAALGVGVSAEADSSFGAGGWFESLYARWKPVSGADGYNAYYSEGEDWVRIDDSLVRTYNDYIRADAVGLVAGSYRVKVVPTVGGSEKAELAMVSDDILVMPYDRSGYAHFNYTDGVGAYNDDGSLKAGAIVLYVTDENKDTVTVKAKDGTTVTGIGNILNSVGQDVGGGKSNKGGKANTNSDILRKLAKEGTPLVVRIVGRVTAPQGLTAYDGVDFGGSEGDNGFMARMSGGKDITIEGIGADSTLDGWGLHFICQTADYSQGIGKSFEVRNLAFQNVPEDCVGMEGQQSGTALTAPVERCWIHHCTFYAPIIANPAESDKDGGDGACDFKRGQYFTNSYCYYNGYHKTNLVGSGDDSLQFNMTYHHNYWKDCESRGPLARQANIHMYNNIFEGQTSYCMSLRANSYIFSEYNMFLYCKKVVDDKDGGVCKSYNNSFLSSSFGNGSVVTVSDRDEAVSSSNKYAGFETKASLSYIPSGDYVIQESISEMKAVVLAYAGRQKADIITPDKAYVSEIPTAQYPTAAVTLDYVKELNKTTIPSSGTYGNVVYNVTKFGSDYIGVGGSTTKANIVFYAPCEVEVILTQHESSGYNAVLANEVGEAMLVGSGRVVVPAGYYFIQSDLYDVGSGKFKEARISGLAIHATEPNAAETPITPPPVAPPKEELPDTPGTDNPGTDNPGTDTPGQGGSVVIPAESRTHNITESGLASDFFQLSGSTSDSKGTVSFNGLTLTKCLKMNSDGSVKLTAPTDGEVTLVFVKGSAGKTLKINGADPIVIPSDAVFVFEVKAGISYEVKKGSGESFLYYLIYTPYETHTHEYHTEEIKATTCETDGEYIYTCLCGDSYTETVEATGHKFRDGACLECGATDPDAEQKPDEPKPEEPKPDEPKPEEPKPEGPETPEEPNPEDPETPEEPETPTEELSFFERIWQAIMDFFRRLFGIEKF